MPRYGYKRRLNGSLTGGSGDVNPQYMHCSAVQSGADAATTTAFQIPIQRLQNAGRAQVMEILKVFWWSDNATEIDSQVAAYLTTQSFGATATNYGNTRMIDAFRKIMVLTTSGQVVLESPSIHDLTDNAGHGFLVGTDNIYIQVVSATTSAANQIYCKILYRWKDVSTTEYVGIVQGQQ